MAALGSPGLVAAFAGNAMPISAAQAAPAIQRVFTFKNLVNSVLAASTREEWKRFKKTVDNAGENVPRLNRCSETAARLESLGLSHSTAGVLY
jgi:hypothetical protein